MYAAASAMKRAKARWRRAQWYRSTAAAAAAATASHPFFLSERPCSEAAVEVGKQSRKDGLGKKGRASERASGSVFLSTPVPFH